MGRPESRSVAHDPGDGRNCRRRLLAGQLLYRLRDVVLLVVVGSFVAGVLNPAVVALQGCKIRRRGTAVATATTSSRNSFG